MINLKGSVKGTKEMAQRIRELAVKVPNAVEAALYAEGQVEMTEAKRRTPVWNPERPVPEGHTPGSLRASGFVHEPKREGRNISVELTFGNEIVDYAVYVHEDLDAYHATGQAKFLESTLKESAPHLKERLAARLQLQDIAK